MADKNQPEKKAEKKIERKPFKPAHPASKMTGKESKNFRGIVRLVGKDIEGHTKVRNALMQIKGIGNNLAASLTKAIQEKLSIDPLMPIGELSEEQVESVEELVKKPEQIVYGAFLLNRKGDVETMQDRHLLGNDLAFQTRMDIQREKEIRSYRGWRHSIGQKVRGQHTRSTGRTGMTVGVVRKSVQQATAAASKEEKK
ncbi:MAG: 30S ribosomal protein S13 [Candidatus Micrarchaeia archaeon]|jgi:small subunit ribosomal protein S13